MRVGVSELASRRPVCRGIVAIFSGAHGQVKREFLVQIAVQPAAMDQRLGPQPNGTEAFQQHVNLLSGVHNQRNRGGHTAPVFRFRRQLLPAGAGQPIVLGAAVVVRYAPFGGQQPS